MTYKLILPMFVALSTPFCAAKVEPTVTPSGVPVAQLWEAPAPGSIATRDLYNGPWGAERAPDAHATYTFVERKQGGTNPGITVQDPQGREWHVKQPSHTVQGDEGPTEVVLSRVLSAVGYHQPPVYFLRSLTVKDATGTHVEPGGRFRLKEKSLKSVDTWSWQQNPFVGTRPYVALLVILEAFASSDLKNVNNTLYEVKHAGEGPDRWYVVRDLGTALGETGRLVPRRNNPDLFEREGFVLGVKEGFVQFNYHGGHQELFRTITPADVTFAVDLLKQLTDSQWREAFRAGGYPQATADRFIARLHERLDEARRVTTSTP
jgi:hypothetical protein